MSTPGFSTSIRALLYDLDGVLIDTNDWHYHALNSALAVHGYQIERNEQAGLYEGLPTSEKLQILTARKHLDPQLHASITEHKNRELLKYFNEAHTVDKSKVMLLRKMRQQGFIQILCSNTTKSTVEAMLRATMLFSYFDHIITRQDLTMPKPHPEVYVKAFGLAHVTPRQALILEDSAHGIAAAKSSGAYVLEVGGAKDVTYATVTKELERHH